MEKLMKLGFSRELLHSFIETNSDAIYLLDLDWNVMYLNSAFESLYGWTSDEIVGRKLPIVPEFLWAEFENLLWSVHLGNEVSGHECIRVKKDGSLIYINLSISRIHDGNGNVAALACIARDITERKLMEQKYFELFNNANDAIYFYELNESFHTNFLEVNRNACDMLNYSKEELLKMSPRDLAPVDFIGKIPVLYQQISEGNTTFEWVQVTKDGICIPVEISAKVFKFNGKNMVISIARDISERKKTHEMALKSEKLSVLGELSAGIAHEIRNPLTSIKGFVQLINSQNDTNQQYCEIILSEIERINSIVGELLLLAKPKPNDFVPVNMADLINQVVTLLNAQAHLTSIEIITEFESKAFIVLCDEIKMKQVMINILKNAIEATTNGKDIQVKMYKEPKDYVTVSIQDQGCGIPKEMMDNLGKPFFTTKRTGTGVGLMLSQKIIADHQGTISYQSEPQVGTTVDIRLPAK